MRVIGLTGNIAFGKSSVAKMFEELGAKVIDADCIARLVVEPDAPAWKEIAEEFGQEILSPDRTINRTKLGGIIFNDKEKREKLNRITHPRIIGKIRELVEDYGKGDVKVVLIEAALIVERGGLKDLIDSLIVVTADEDTVIKRLMERNKFVLEDAISRIKSQMPIAEKVKHADYVIDNSGTLEETKKQVGEVWKRINTESK